MTAEQVSPGRAELIVRVHGAIPAPQGSKSYKGMRNGKPILAESSKKVAPWRYAVATAARSAMLAAGWMTLDCAVELAVIFYLPAPKTMPKGRTAPTTYPDLSKLVRSTEDALVAAKIVKDDARFIREVSEKEYAIGRPPGAWIRVRAMTDMLL